MCVCVHMPVHVCVCVHMPVHVCMNVFVYVCLFLSNGKVTTLVTCLRVRGSEHHNEHDDGMVTHTLSQAALPRLGAFPSVLE